MLLFIQELRIVYPLPLALFYVSVSVSLLLLFLPLADIVEAFPYATSSFSHAIRPPFVSRFHLPAPALQFSAYARSEGW